MKKILFLTILFAHTAFYLSAQWTGNNPTSLMGRAYIKGSSLNNTGVGLNPRTLSLERSFQSTTSSNSIFESTSVGLRFIHKTPTTSTTNEWDIASTGSMLHLRYASGNSNVLSLNSAGKVGIMSSSPDATLHVKNVNNTALDAHLEGFTLIDGDQASLLLGSTTGAPLGEFGIEYNSSGLINGLNFWRPNGANSVGNYLMFIADDGNISIGTDDSRGYKLAVKGEKGIIAEEVTIKLHSMWPDYVFNKDYNLLSLKEVEDYYTKNSRLPDVPSAVEVSQNGVKIGEMNAALLRKIEELTIYTVEQQKQIDLLLKTINELTLKMSK